MNTPVFLGMSASTRWTILLFGSSQCPSGQRLNVNLRPEASLREGPAPTPSLAFCVPSAHQPFSSRMNFLIFHGKY